MTGTIRWHEFDASDASFKRAQVNFANLVAHVANLYCMGEASSVSSCEAQELAMSTIYVLGIADASPEEAARVLDVDDPIQLWRDAVSTLESRVDDALAVWREINEIMPPIRNVSLRDTLASLGELRLLYDIHFAAHVVPCDIDYQLSEPADSQLMGIDYIEAWLGQLLKETRWIAQYDTESCIAVLERVCPDYRGLHVSLYDLLAPYEHELEMLQTN